MKALVDISRFWMGRLGMLIALAGGPSEHIAAQTIHQEFQFVSQEKQGFINPEAVSLQDTMLHYNFPPVEIEGQYRFENKQQENKYHQLYLDIKRVYPLSKIVSGEVKLVNRELDSVYLTKSDRKRYLKWYEKHIYHTYLDTLKSLNARQTRLFIKLINRETGSSPYDLVKRYRGSMDAFLWQLAANAMLLNLKKEYDPHEDAMLEDILVKFY